MPRAVPLRVLLAARLLLFRLIFIREAIIIVITLAVRVVIVEPPTVIVKLIPVLILIIIVIILLSTPIVIQSVRRMVEALIVRPVPIVVQIVHGVGHRLFGNAKRFSSIGLDEADGWIFVLEDVVILSTVVALALRIDPIGSEWWQLVGPLSVTVMAVVLVRVSSLSRVVSIISCMIVSMHILVTSEVHILVRVMHLSEVWVSMGHSLNIAVDVAHRLPIVFMVELWVDLMLKTVLFIV